MQRRMIVGAQIAPEPDQAAPEPPVDPVRLARFGGLRGQDRGLREMGGRSLLP